MANTEKDMNFYPGRIVMFLKIKNKFRFVSIFLLLASLVTVVSSASADESETVAFPFTVEADSNCSDDDIPATWAPRNATGPLVVNPGSEVTVVADPEFEHGWTDCDGISLNTTGYVTSTIDVPVGWTSSVECYQVNHCIADPMEESIAANFTVPQNAELRNDYEASLNLIWIQ
jgi:hypothetical protein